MHLLIDAKLIFVAILFGYYFDPKGMFLRMRFFFCFAWERTISTYHPKDGLSASDLRKMAV